MPMPRDFNPLPPHGGRLAESIYFDRRKTFQSTPSAWRETYLTYEFGEREPISIHSLRMEGDIVLFDVKIFRQNISIHSLRMEGDGQC